MKSYIPKTIAVSIGLLAALAVGILTSCSRKSENTQVAAMLPLTGNLAFLGEPGRIALQIAQKDLRAAGKPLSFGIDDTKASPEETVTLMRKEKDVNGRSIFIVTLSGPSMAARESFAKEDVAILAVAIHPDLPSSNAPIVRFCFSARQEAEMLIQKIVQSKESIGLVLSHDAATTFEAERIIIPALQAAGKKIVFTEWFDVGNKDFHNLTARYNQEKPKELLVLGYGSDFPAALGAIAVTRQTDELKVYGGIGFVEMERPPAGFDKSKFNIAVPAVSIGSGSSAARAFRDKFKAVKGGLPSYDAAFTYDAAMVLGDLAQKGITKPKDIITALRGHSFEGVSGKIEIDESGEAKTDMRWATYGPNGLEESKP
ncbi:MAG TPA: ABC transporter substrate-binding protein [Candidatus Binatia bacterium]|nr:ABC transporter substrate-binding protein [Candidatus Binatia bacterium]